MTEERLIYIVDFQNQKRDPQLVSHFNPTSEILSASQKKKWFKNLFSRYTRIASSFLSDKNSFAFLVIAKGKR